jgi:tripeptide aminopeptidase
MISDLETPEDPRTTFNVGTINGGTSVNTIAQEASMVIDIRSTSNKELLKIEEKIINILHAAAKAENARWAMDGITVT